MLLGPDTEENLQDLFYENGWTDGNPIILPTRERVEKMQTGTCADPDEVVAEVFIMDTKELIRPTVTNIAVIAVMAGAKPEHFPVILAIASTGQSSLMPSTTHFESMLLVNGPIAREIGMNSGLAAFSAVNRANSVIGRAWTLMSHCWDLPVPKQPCGVRRATTIPITICAWRKTRKRASGNLFMYKRALSGKKAQSAFSGAGR